MKPTYILDKGQFLIGIAGMIAIAFNLWYSIFAIEKSPTALFFYVILAFFSTSFFTWLIIVNVRWWFVKSEWRRKRLAKMPPVKKTSHTHHDPHDSDAMGKQTNNQHYTAKDR